MPIRPWEQITCSLPQTAMVFAKIALVGFAIVAMMAYAQTSDWFARAGVVGSCTELRAPVAGARGTQWWQCKEGALTGYPSLTRESCTIWSARGGVQIWRCPQPIERPGSLF
jgi:hypothetical protein